MIKQSRVGAGRMALQCNNDDPSAPEISQGACEINAGDMQVHENIGTGRSAEVFRGTYNGKVVAIKQFIKNRWLDPKEQVRFTREVSILFKCKHENLVQLIGATFTIQPYTIVMEYCAGLTLFELVHTQIELELAWVQQIKMCNDVAAGMHYLHSLSPTIIHRDLKSLNLLLTQKIECETDVPMVKVTDFGMGRMKESGADSWGKMTKEAGTLHWMAPEVFDCTEYDEKVDVYSYAMVLFEIICREVPFDEEDPIRIGILVVRGGRPDMEAVPPDCPPLLESLMVSCWAGNPQERPSFESIVCTLGSVNAPFGS